MSETNIHPRAIVEPGATLGAGVHVGPFSVIKTGAHIHDGVTVHGSVHISGNVTLGENSEVYPQAVLGQPPQDFKFKGEETRLIIGKRTIIREQVSMHPGTAVGHGVTQIGDDGYFMVGAHVGHDCVVGNHVVLSNGVALGGYVNVGDYANLSGLVGVHQFTRIGHHAFIGALAYVSCDVIPYGMATGNPAQLNGLNIVGMQRTGMARDDIRKARAAYKSIFHADGSMLFTDRVDAAQSQYPGNGPALDIINFINSRAQRPLCLPNER